MTKIIEDIFVNRKEELKALNAQRNQGGLIVVYGRRRMGKTRLLVKWLKTCAGLYTQAIEGSRDLQMDQLYQDLAPYLSTEIRPKTWLEFFQLLDLQKKQLILCIDEFPYLVQSDSSFPSLLQKWWDHRKKRDILLVLCGSSRRMMHNAILNISAPLYGRAKKIIPILPMKYMEFCEYTHQSPAHRDSFILYSLVGGVPKYWELLKPRMTPLEAAQELYFGFAAYMENEPRRILADEQIAGAHPISVMEAIGRGAEKPSEIAARLEIPHTQLSKVFYPLLDASLIQRDIPFGQSERNPKNVLYKIVDPSLRFWYRVYSPHKSRWSHYTENEKRQFLLVHASSVFEDTVRQSRPASKRYWEKDNEFDAVQKLKNNEVILTEVKFAHLSQSEKNSLEKRIITNWGLTQLAQKFPSPRVEIVDLSWLKKRT